MLVDAATYINGVRNYEFNPASVDGFSWVGLENPTAEELAKYETIFALHPLAVEDALSSRQRPKLDVYSDHAFIVLKTAKYDALTGRVITGDIGIFIGDRFILITRHGDAIPLRSIRGDLERQPSRLGEGVTAVLHEVLDRLVDQYTEVAVGLQEDVEAIEDVVFDDDIPAPSKQLYMAKRELLYFRRAVQPLLEPLHQLATSEVDHVLPSFQHLFADVRDHLMKVTDDVNTMNELMDAALDANLALIQVQQNGDMRKISAWVGIGAVPTMVAGIYGMNFKHLPELEWRYGYFLVLGVLSVTAIWMFRRFRKNNWL